MNEPRAELVGRTLAGTYRVVRPLGQGGMGVVYEAIDERSGRRVALKVLFDEDPSSLARFRQEARAMASVAHPNVAAVLDFQSPADAPPFFVMELVSGTTLASLLKRDGRLAQPRAVAIVRQMLDALDAAHRAGVVHRDVKPGNVMLEGERVKIVDFGIAKLLDGTGVKTRTGAIVGTPAYLAPEQILGQSVDARTDLHAVGLVLAEMVLGRRLAPSERIELPEPLGAVVRRALAPMKEDRFASAAEMRAALDGQRSLPRAVLVAAIALAIAAPGVAIVVALWPAERRAAAPPPIASVDAATPMPAATLTEPDASPDEDAAIDAGSDAASIAKRTAVANVALNDGCVCREVLAHRYMLDLCPTRQPGSCFCEAAPGQRLCSHQHAYWLAECTDRAVSGDEGAPCEGWLVGEKDQQWTKGTLSCTYCNGLRPKVRAVHGTRCEGYATEGTKRPGVWLCDGLIPPGAPGGKPLPPGL